MAASARGPFGALPPQVLMVTAIVGLGALAVLSMTQVKSLKQRVREREQEILAVREQNQQLSQQLTQVQTEHQQLQDRLNELRSQLASATSERDRFHGSIDDLQQRYDALEQERAQETTRFQEEIRQITKARDEVTARVQELESQKTSLEQTTAKLRNRLAFLDRDYQQLLALYTQAKQPRAPQEPLEPGSSVIWSPDQLEPPPPATQAGQSASLQQPPPSSMPATAGGMPTPGMPIGVASEPAAPQRPTIELAPIVVRRTESDVTQTLRGRVVEVNPFHKFAVIDKGSLDGVQSGMMFEVLRGSQTVGHVVAIRVRPQLTACEIVAARSQGLPQVGDLAMQTTR